MDDRIPQGRQVHRLGPLLGARGQEGSGARGREGERRRPGGPDCPGEGLRPVVHGRRRQQLLRGVDGGRGVRGEADGEGALPVEGQGRVQEGRPPVRGGLRQDPGRVLQHVLHHAERRLLVPVRARLGRREAPEPEEAVMNLGGGQRVAGTVAYVPHFTS